MTATVSSELARLQTEQQAQRAEFDDLTKQVNDLQSRRQELATRLVANDQVIKVLENVAGNIDPDGKRG